MKKIFTLIAVAVMALTASAKQTLDITLFSPWGEACVWDAASSKMTFNEAWTGAGLWLGGDYSDYDVVVLKLKSSTASFNFTAEYMDAEGNVDTSKPSSLVSGLAGTSLVAITLDENYSDVLAQVWIQGKEPGELVIDEIYAGTFEEYEADKASASQGGSKSDVSLAGWGKWGDDITLTENADGSLTIAYPAEWGGVNKWFGGADYSDFDKCVVELAEPVDFTTQLFVQYTNSKEGGAEYNVTAQAQPGETKIELALDADYKNAINQIAIQNDAAGTVTIKAIYFCTNNYSGEAGGEKKQPLSLADLGSGWSSTYDAATKTITYEGEWTGRGWWLDTDAYNEFDKFVVKFEPVDFYIQAVMEYFDASGEKQMATVGAEAGASVIEVAIPADIQKIQQLYIQSSSVGAVTLTEAYAASASTDIKAVPTTATQPGAVYNLRGQKVNADYKGLVIKNGKKMLQK